MLYGISWCFQLRVPECTVVLVNTRVARFAISSVYRLWWQSFIAGRGVRLTRCHVSPASNNAYVDCSETLSHTRHRIYGCLYANPPVEMFPLGYTLISHVAIRIQIACKQRYREKQKSSVSQLIDQLIKHIYYTAPIIIRRIRTGNQAQSWPSSFVIFDVKT